MASQPELDDLSKFEAKETSRKLPAGWLVLFWGLIAWGAYYLWAYTPALGGWSQAQDLEGGGAAMGTNLLATIAFTAIPTVVAIAIVLAQRSKKGSSGPGPAERARDRGPPARPRDRDGKRRMGTDTAYLVFGATLCVALVAVAVFYYRRGRHDRVESPKYRMLEDDDDDR